MSSGSQVPQREKTYGRKKMAKLELGKNCTLCSSKDNEKWEDVSHTLRKYLLHIHLTRKSEENLKELLKLHNKRETGAPWWLGRLRNQC